MYNIIHDCSFPKISLVTLECFNLYVYSDLMFFNSIPYVFHAIISSHLKDFYANND